MTDKKKCNAEALEDPLSDLESKLRNAYVQKHLKAQIAEKKAQRMSDELQERIFTDLMNTSALNSNKNLHRSEQQHSLEVQNYRKELEKQIFDKKFKAEYEKCEEELERSVLIEVDKVREAKEKANKIWAKVSVADKLMRQNLTQREMKEIYRQKKKVEELEEEDRNQRYLLEVETRNRRLEIAEEERMARRQTAIDSLVKALMDQTSDIDERKELLSEIIAEELKQEDLARAMMNEFRRRRMMNNLAEDLKQQMEIKEELKTKIVENEAKFAEDTIRKIMESEIMVRQTDLARKRKKIEYREELKRIIEERKQKREEEVEEMWRLIEMQRLEELEMKEKFKEERKELLRKHFENVKEFLDPISLTEEEVIIISERNNNSTNY